MLKVDTQGTVKAPDLMSYSFKIEFDEDTVHANDAHYTDSHLSSEWT